MNDSTISVFHWFHSTNLFWFGKNAGIICRDHQRIKILPSTGPSGLAHRNPCVYHYYVSANLLENHLCSFVISLPPPEFDPQEVQQPSLLADLHQSLTPEGHE